MKRQQLAAEKYKDEGERKELGGDFRREGGADVTKFEIN